MEQAGQLSAHVNAEVEQEDTHTYSAALITDDIQTKLILVHQPLDGKRDPVSMGERKEGLCESS